MRSARSCNTLLVLCLGMLVLVVGCGGGPNRERYIRENDALIAELPVYPGATEVERVTAPDRAEENGPIVGYTTRVMFRLPQGATGEEVADFYERRLTGEWDLVESLDGPVRNFRRAAAFVSINLDSWRNRALEIGVDYNEDTS